MEQNENGTAAQQRRRKTWFETQVEPHRRALAQFARSLTPCQADAEDLVQDTLLRAYLYWDTYCFDRSLSAWLHTILRNRYREVYGNRNKRRPSLPLCVVEEYGRPGTAGAHDAAFPSPERSALLRMEARAFAEAVAALPEKYRASLMLAVRDELSYVEIANRLCIPVGTVRSRINRGRSRLERSLYSWRDGNGDHSGKNPAYSAGKHDPAMNLG